MLKHFREEVTDHIYVISNEEMNEAIESLIEYTFPFDYITYNPKEKTIILKDGTKKKYFEGQFEKFKQISANMKLEDFIKPISNDHLYYLMQSIERTFKTYVYFDGYMEYITLDEFIRQAEEGKQKYYFGNVLKYV